MSAEGDGGDDPRPCSLGPPAARNLGERPADEAGMAPRTRPERSAAFCVDDDGDLAHRIKLRLESAAPAPIEVTVALTLHDALETLRASPRFGGYLVDWVLDRRRSCEPLLQAIRALDPSAPLWILTGYGSDPGLCRAARVRFDATVLEKPPPRDTWATLASTVSRRAASLDAREERIANAASPGSLTPRQLLVLQAALDGSPPAAIAGALGVSVRRVLRTLAECTDVLMARSLDELRCEGL